MATEQEIIDARLQINDNQDLESALVDLSTIVGGAGDFELFIKRGDTQFNLGRLKSVLESRDANYDTMVSDIETAILTLLGPDEITASTVRKALRDLVTANEANIAAT